VHRDLKAANVFMHNGRAKIADFGFATFARYFMAKAGRASKMLA
jgi:serine/threonine protein kinase